MPTIKLDDDEWQRVMAIISQAPWNVANPLLMKIGEQLRMQTVQQQQTTENIVERMRSPKGNSNASHDAAE